MAADPPRAASGILELCQEPSFGDGEESTEYSTVALSAARDPNDLRNLVLKPTDRLYVQQIFYRPPPPCLPPLWETSTRMRELKDIFDLFDEHEKGELRLPQVLDLLRELRFVGDDPSLTQSDYAKRILQCRDLDGSGGLNFEEFVSEPLFLNLTKRDFGAKQPPRSLQEARAQHPVDECIQFAPDTYLWDRSGRPVLEWRERNARLAAAAAEQQRREEEARQAEIARQKRLHGSFYTVKDTCLISVLEFLHLLELVPLSAVSTRLRRLARNTALWPRLPLSSTSPDTHPYLYSRIALLRLLDFPEALPHGLDMSWTRHTDDDLLTLVCGLSSHLRVLRVAGAASLTDKCAEGIALYCDQLEELDVSTTQMDVDKVLKCLVDTQAHKHLQCLRVGSHAGHCRITSQGLATLSAFRNLCTLEVVGLPPAVLTSEALGAVVQANPQLTHLDLSTCHSEGQPPSCPLGRPLQCLPPLAPALRSLTLRHYSAAADCLPALATFTALTHLDLGFGDIEAIPLGALRPLRGLKSLHLDGNGRLAQLPGDTPPLVTLNVCSTAVDPVVILNHLTTLQTLLLSNSCHIQEGALPSPATVHAAEEEQALAAGSPCCPPSELCPPSGRCSSRGVSLPDLHLARASIVGSLRLLSHLVLRHQNLCSLHPAVLRALPSLTVLDLSHNNIDALPLDIGTIKGLRRLTVHHNRLSQVPYTGGLDTLAELRELDVSHNSITVGVPGSGPPRLRLFWTAHNRFGQGTLEVPWATLQPTRGPHGAVHDGPPLLHRLRALVLRHHRALQLPSEAPPTAGAPAFGAPPSSSSSSSTVPRSKRVGGGDGAAHGGPRDIAGARPQLQALGVVFVQATARYLCAQVVYVATQAGQYRYRRGYCLLGREDFHEVHVEFHDILPSTLTSCGCEPPEMFHLHPVAWLSCRPMPREAHFLQLHVQETPFHEVKGGQKVLRYKFSVALQAHEATMTTEALGTYIHSLSVHVTPFGGGSESITTTHCKAPPFRHEWIASGPCEVEVEVHPQPHFLYPHSTPLPPLQLPLRSNSPDLLAATVNTAMSAATASRGPAQESAARKEKKSSIVSFALIPVDSDVCFFEDDLRGPSVAPQHRPPMAGSPTPIRKSSTSKPSSQRHLPGLLRPPAPPSGPFLAVLSSDELQVHHANGQLRWLPHHVDRW